MDNKSFKILSIDGGGIRGIFPTYILKRIKDELDINYNDEFELIVGTSTGAIIAGALAINIPIEDVYKLYKNKSRSIFQERKFSLKGILKSKFDSNYLEDLFKKIFGNKKLGEIKNVRLIIPSIDISNGTVHLFRSNYSDMFVRDKEVFLFKAIIASCSAPIYFDPKRINSYLLADGGLWANNPSMVGLTEALSKLNISKEKVKIFSIGTGISKKYYELDPKRSWGIATGWGKTKLIDLIFNLQTIASNNFVRLFLQDNYLRINFETEKELTLDNSSIIPYLETKADYEFTHNFKEIKEFFIG
jgi:hypothetical protein